MPERLVYWRALADFSKVREEAKRTKKSIEDLNNEVDDLNDSNKRLSDSQEDVAKSNKRTGDSFASTADKIAKAKKKQRDAISDATKAEKDAMAGSATARLEAVKAARAAEQEARASEQVTQAQKNLKQARLDQATATRKVTAAEKARSAIQKSDTATAKDLANAERDVTKARDARTRAVGRTRAAEEALSRTVQHESKVFADNAFAAAKSAADYEKAEQKKAQAAADSQRRRQDYSEKQDRIDARAARLADERRRVSEERNARADARDSSRQEAKLRQTLETNRKLLAEERRLSAAQAAAANARKDASAPSRDLEDLTSRVQQVSSKINKTPDNKINSQQAASASGLARAINQVNSAMAAEATAADRVNSAEEDLARTRAVHTETLREAHKAEEDLKSVREDVGNTDRDIADAETRAAKARRDVAASSSAMHAAETRLAGATRSLGDAGVRAEGSIRGLENATRRASRAFGGAGGGGNIFTRSMNKMYDGVQRVDKATTGMIRRLHLLRWGALAGAAYVFIEALSVVTSSLFALGSAVAPAVGALAAAIPVAYGLGTALLSVKAAFSGIGGVLKAYQTAQTKAGAAGAKTAKAESDNADRIKDAQDNLRDARAQVGITAKAGAEQVAEASRTIVEANRAELDAQKDLDQARKDARKNIDDLKNAVIDAALAERGAVLDLADARENLQNVMNDPNATRNDRERAQLQVDQAAQGSKEASQNAASARTDATSAVTKGVEGDSGVIAAKRQVADATYAAQKAERDFRKTLDDASRDNAKAIRSVADAQRNLAKAQRQSSAALDSAGSSADAYKEKLAQLPPAAQKFVEKLISMRKYWDQLKDTAASNLFPGLTRGLDRLPKLFPVIRSGIASVSKEVGNFGDRFAKMITTPKWISAFKQFNGAATPILRHIGNAILHIVDTMRAVGVAAIPLAKKLTAGFDAWTRSINKSADAAEKSGRMRKFFEKTYDVLHQLGQIAKNIGSIFYNLGTAASDSGRDMLTSMQKTTAGWAKWTKDNQGVLHKFFDDVRENMRTLDGYIGRIALGFLKMGDNKNFKPILDGLADIFNAIKEAFGGQGSGVSEAFVSLLHGIARVIRSISDESSGLSVFIGTLNLLLDGLNAILDIPGVAPALGAMFAAFAAFKALKLFGAISGINLLGGAIWNFIKKSRGAESAGKKAAAGLAAANAAANAPTGGAGAAAAGGAGAAAASRGGGGALAAGAGGAAAAALPPGKADRAPNRPGNPSSGKAYATTRPAAAGAGAAEKNAGKRAGGLLGAVTLLPTKLKGAADGLKMFFSGASKFGKGGPWALLIGAIVTALVVLYVKVKGFRDFINKAFQEIWKIVKPVVMFMVGAFKNLGNAFKNLWNALQPIFQLLKPLLPLFKILGYVLGALILAPILSVIAALTVLAGILGVVANVIAWAINNIIVPVIKAVIAAVQWMGSAFSAVGSAIAATWNFIAGVFKAIIGVIWAIVKTGFKIIAAVILAPIAALIALFKWIWSKIGDNVKTVLGNIKNWLKAAWDVVKTVTRVAWNIISDYIINPIKTAFNALKTAWNTVWGWLKSAWNTAKSVAKTVWDAIAGAIGRAFGAVKGVIQSVWDKVTGIFTTAINFVTQKILNNLIKAINWVITKFGISKIPTIDPIGKADGGTVPKASANAASGKVLARANGGLVPDEAHAAGGRVRNVGSMIPGYTPGRDPHEFVSNTGYRINLSGGEGILTPETVRAMGGKSAVDRMNATHSSRLRNRAFGGGVGSGALMGMGMESHDKGGTVGNNKGTAAQNRGADQWGLWRTLKVMNTENNSGGFLGGLGSAISGIAGKVAGWARKGLATVMKGAFNAAEAPARFLVDKIPPAGKSMFSKVINNMFDKVNKGVYDTIAGNNPKAKKDPTKIHDDGNYGKSGIIRGDKAKNDIMVSGLVLNGMAGSQNPVKPEFTKQVMNAFPGEISALKTIISNESGWNSRAVNKTDSNAKAGHPSQGLMQTIAGTFNAYKNPNLNRGILDPIANVTAGTGYANSRYGGLSSVPGVKAVNAGKKYVGYGNGGLVQHFHKGGVVAGKQYSNGSPVGLTRASKNGAIAAINTQAGVAFQESNNSGLYSATLKQIAKRLSGVDAGHDVVNTTTLPKVQGLVSGDSGTSKGMMNWVDKHDPRSYGQLWSKQPYGTSKGYPNSYHRNPLLPILSYAGNPTLWKNYRKTKDSKYWTDLAAKINAKKAAAAKGKTKNSKVETTHKGFKNLESVKTFIHKADKKPYVFGAVGPDAYDCSGITGEVWARLTDHPSYRRYFSTHNENKYFKPGKGDGVYVVGVSNNRSEEHTAGRLDGLKFEARSTNQGIIVGNKARNPESFDKVYHLPAKKIKGVKNVKEEAKAKKVTVAELMKKYPKRRRDQLVQEKQWNRSIGILGGATAKERSRIASMRKAMGLKGAGNNGGMFSSDMQNPLDHVSAHMLNKAHPADWQHPWLGGVTSVESALSESDRSNSLNKEWFDDLNQIAAWGMPELVNYLLGKGIADGLSIARSSVKDKKTAQQLNDSIKAGLVTTGVNADDQTSILKIVAKLGSGTTTKPYGLRDVSSSLNVADYVPVNLFDKMTAQLKKLPDALTKRFITDVNNYRKGTFYAATGGLVPGDRGSANRDTVPAMLVPGEGVLTRKAMSIIGGEAGLNALNNNDMAPQMRANGGMILSPTFDQMGLGKAANTYSNTRSTMANRTGVAGNVNINTTINNPTGESSVYSQNKMLQRQAALGTVAKVVGS